MEFFFTARLFLALLSTVVHAGGPMAKRPVPAGTHGGHSLIAPVVGLDTPGPAFGTAVHSWPSAVAGFHGAVLLREGVPRPREDSQAEGPRHHAAVGSPAEGPSAGGTLQRMLETEPEDGPAGTPTQAKLEAAYDNPETKTRPLAVDMPVETAGSLDSLKSGPSLTPFRRRAKRSAAAAVALSLGLGAWSSPALAQDTRREDGLRAGNAEALGKRYDELLLAARDILARVAAKSVFQSDAPDFHEAHPILLAQWRRELGQIEAARYLGLITPSQVDRAEDFLSRLRGLDQGKLSSALLGARNEFDYLASEMRLVSLAMSQRDVELGNFRGRHPEVPGTLGLVLSAADLDSIRSLIEEGEWMEAGRDLRDALGRVESHTSRLLWYDADGKSIQDDLAEAAAILPRASPLTLGKLRKAIAFYREAQALHREGIPYEYELSEAGSLLNDVVAAITREESEIGAFLAAAAARNLPIWGIVIAPAFLLLWARSRRRQLEEFLATWGDGYEGHVTGELDSLQARYNLLRLREPSLLPGALAHEARALSSRIDEDLGWLRATWGAEGGLRSKMRTRLPRARETLQRASHFYARVLARIWPYRHRLAWKTLFPEYCLTEANWRFFEEKLSQVQADLRRLEGIFEPGTSLQGAAERKAAAARASSRLGPSASTVP